MNLMITYWDIGGEGAGQARQACWACIWGWIGVWGGIGKGEEIVTD